MALTKAHNRMIKGAALNVLDFGAVGDGTTDDTTAIQAAIDAAISQRKELHFPANTYLVTNLTADVSVGDGVFLTGELKSIIKSASAGKILDVNPASLGLGNLVNKSVVIDTLQFEGDGVNVEGLVRVGEISYGITQTRNCQFRGASDKYLVLDNCWATEIDNCGFGYSAVSRIATGTYGIYVINANAVSITDTYVTQISSDGDSIGVFANSCNAFSMQSCTIEGNWVSIDAAGNAQGSVSIDSCYFEIPPGAVLTARPVEDPVIQLRSMNGGSVTNCHSSFTPGHVFSHLEGCNGIIFEGNFCAQSEEMVVLADEFSHDNNLGSGNELLIGGLSSRYTTTQFTRTKFAFQTPQMETAYYPASAFMGQSSGTVTAASTSYGGKILAFGDTGDNFADGMLPIPAHWGKCEIRVYAVVSAVGTTGTFNYSIGGVEATVYDAVPSGPSSASTATLPAGYASEGLLYLARTTLDFDRTEHNSLARVTFIRRSASNTLTGNLQLHGIILERRPYGVTTVMDRGIYTN